MTAKIKLSREYLYFMSMVISNFGYFIYAKAFVVSEMVIVWHFPSIEAMNLHMFIY